MCDTVDRIVLERDRVAKPVVVDDPDDYAVRVRRLPLLGRAVPGLEIRVVDPDTFEDRPERHVGELIIRGTSVTPGYYRRRTPPPRCSTTAGCAPATWPTCSTASSSCAAGSRT